ncbi:proton-associated sugar transporter A [Caerostris extrusa]|uniref:Proton-associated sugar transporter A n=1 Tax=Caerostris extrusa TaxID=172846 RepID=A0AAV4XSC6_CAEEX|nr:proton-associated sugar transporter A [Caerostris extrusa]
MIETAMAKYNGISVEISGESQEDMHKTSPYVRTVVALHNLRDRAKDAVDSLHEKGLAERVTDNWNKTQTAVAKKARTFFRHPDNVELEHLPQDYGYVFRPKSCWELILLSGTVCGIEFCYSAERAFITPILLSLSLNIKFVTMIWWLSPLIGLMLTPILGSMSDSWESKMGRRRPFIFLYSIGILVGLVLVPNGHTIGLALGDTINVKAPNSVKVSNETSNMLRNMEQRSVTETQDMLLSRSLEDATINLTIDSFNISDLGNESEIPNKSFWLKKRFL